MSRHEKKKEKKQFVNKKRNLTLTKDPLKYELSCETSMKKKIGSNIERKSHEGFVKRKHNTLSDQSDSKTKEKGDENSINSDVFEYNKKQKSYEKCTKHVQIKDQIDRIDNKLKAVIENYLHTNERATTAPVYIQKLKNPSDINIDKTDSSQTVYAKNSSRRSKSYHNRNSKSTNEKTAQDCARRNLGGKNKNEKKTEDVVVGMMRSQMRDSPLHMSRARPCNNNRITRDMGADKFLTNKFSSDNNNNMDQGTRGNYKYSHSLCSRHTQEKPYVFKTVDVKSRRKSKFEFNGPPYDLQSESCFSLDPLRDDHKPYMFRTININRIGTCDTPRYVNFGRSGINTKNKEKMISDK